eukprot:7166475-Prymnesium_polylepis.3
MLFESEPVALDVGENALEEVERETAKKIKYRAIRLREGWVARGSPSAALAMPHAETAWPFHGLVFGPFSYKAVKEAAATTRCPDGFPVVVIERSEEPRHAATKVMRPNAFA